MHKVEIRILAVLVSLALGPVAHADDPPPACPFGPGDLPVTTLPPGTPHGAEIPINHIVVLMQENRSYDHYLGQLRKQGVERQPKDASNPDPTGGAPIRAFHEKGYCAVADPSHSWNGTHRSWNDGAMDGFTTANVDPADPTGRRSMGYYQNGDLNYYYRLYKLFATGDRYFCSMLGPTFPNRFFLVAGTSFGHIRNDIPSTLTEFSQPTIFNQLDDAGVSWKIYFAQITENFVFAYVRNQPEGKVVPIAEYFADAAAGTLPQVSFVEPVYIAGVNVQSDEHPPANVQVGQDFAAGVINALLASPQWSDSALFFTYDEHGGFYDHVPPPPACVPDGIAPVLQPSDVVAVFDRYGIRVPMVVVSPYARKKFVSHTVYDHTSILRFIQTRFDVPALTARDANADPMLELFDFAAPPFTRPPKLPSPRINQKRLEECAVLYP